MREQLVLQASFGTSFKHRPSFDTILLEVPGPDIPRKHDIQLFIRSTGSLRDSEVAPYERNCGESSKEESNLSSDVCLVWVEPTSQ